MHSSFQILVALAAAGVLPAALAAPAPQMSKYGENTGPIAGYPPIPEATAASGSLYGGKSLLGEVAKPYPVSGGDSAIVSDYTLVNGQEAEAKLGLYLDFNSVENPQPIRGEGGQTDPGASKKFFPHLQNNFREQTFAYNITGTYAYERLNPDRFAPPGTDSKSVPNAQWPMGLSHNRFGTGKQSGYARQQNSQQLPAATDFAGVDMRLAPHAYRELHWHTANEWSLIMKGSVRLSAVNEKGETFTDDVGAGDVWFFPAGVPHSIQALDEGVEFLLVFDDGAFSEDATFLVSEMFLRNPKEVLSKNFQAPISAFDNIPQNELYIFDGTPAPQNISLQNQTGPAGILPYDESYTYHWSQQEPYVVPGGSVKIIDTTTFPIAKNFASALVTIQPGAMREMHWHLTSDEWNFFLQGSARITVYLAPDSSNTFDFTAGDVGYIPASNSHYIENTGTEDVIFLEVLNQPVFSDISVAQWLALTPKQVVKDHLHLPDSVLDNLPKQKTYLKPGNKNMTALAADPNGTAAYESGNGERVRE
ncbi:related to oxalate decarboxylase [Rhynchosporium secalis]|uniref:Related to oxalate decarboxylase n=1 Tax=Rhynchosporium secalis TaxID=38038 RepID=A0A1E1LWL8_RHYSE|nr:related to oxalate decarboxylase [Rhynchosporium secalis]